MWVFCGPGYRTDPITIRLCRLIRGIMADYCVGILFAPAGASGRVARVFIRLNVNDGNDDNDSIDINVA